LLLGWSIAIFMDYKYKVVITDVYDNVSEIENRILGSVGASVVAGHCKDTTDIIDKAHDADALLVGDLPITKEVFDKLTKLKVVARYGVGFDNVDVRSATAAGVQVAITPEVMTTNVAEHTLALMLTIVRKIPMADNLVKEGKWSDPSKWAGPIPTIHGKTVGIIGLGRIGRAVVDLLRCFGVEIIGYDPYLSPETTHKLGFRIVPQIEPLLTESDFVTMHLPLTDQTRHMIGERELGLLKKTAFVVNCARGAIVDPKALYTALFQGRIAGAAMDVFENEPIDPTDPLLTLKNFIATPHMAFYSDDVHEKFRTEAAKEVARVLSGLRPTNLVNPEVLTQRTRCQL